MLDATPQRTGHTNGPPDLTACIARGDGKAEQQFVLQYERYVRSLVRQNSRANDPDVSDVVQEVLTAVLAKLRSGAVQSIHALPAYIQTTVVRMTAEEYRRRPLRPQADMAAVDAHIDESADPGDAVDQERCGRIIRRLIDELPTARDRDVLRLFYIEQESKEHVCRTLGIDPSHFHRVTFRARQRLGDLLREQGLAFGPGETHDSKDTPA